VDSRQPAFIRTTSSGEYAGNAAEATLFAAAACLAETASGLHFMKIAQVAPLYESVPPRAYGGTERIVSYLTEGLVALGHDVTLFASAESRTAARLVPMRSESLWADRSKLKCEIAAHLTELDHVARRAGEFDVLHFHTEIVHLPLFEQVAERTITTLHGRLDIEDLPEAYARWSRYPLVSISDSQRQPLANANWAGTVYHGLPLDLLQFDPKRKGGYLAFLGRVSPEKGVDHAIRIAQQSGMPLKIAAKVDPANIEYYRDVVQPALQNPQIEFVGEIGDAEKSEFLGNALALLFPIEWPEPFGLVMIEAMACGTPVIALDRGSVPEVLEHGVSGIIVSDVADAARAISAAGALDRRRVRQAFERRFSATTMTRNYLALYERLVAGGTETVALRAAG
jgi:glycosyltransferase involved in cell wall biosynthesis